MAIAIKGKNGRLFLDNDQNNVMQQHRGKIGLDKNKLEVWKELLYKRNIFCKEKKIDFYFLIAPDPQSVFSEDMKFKATQERPIFQLIQYLENDQILKQICYPLDELIDKKSASFELFPKTDTHWTSYGSFVAYEAFMKMISNKYKNLKILKENDIEFITKQQIGDLGNKVVPHVKSDFVTATIKSLNGREIYNNQINVRGRLQIFENIDKNLPTCIWFGTSYTYSMLKYLKESFSQVIFIHQAKIDYKIIEKINPDIVVSELSERFLLNPPMDSVNSYSEDFFIEKISKMSENKLTDLLLNIRKQRQKNNSNQHVDFFAHIHEQNIEKVINSNLNIEKISEIESNFLIKDRFLKLLDNDFLFKHDLKSFSFERKTCFIVQVNYKKWLIDHGVNINYNIIIESDSINENLKKISLYDKIIILSPYEKELKNQVSKLLEQENITIPIYRFIRDIKFARKCRIEPFEEKNLFKSQEKKLNIILVFTLPRSGSTFFIDSLGQSDKFGLPREHIQHDIVSLVNFGIITLEEYLEYVFLNTATSNNVTMSKIIDGWFLNIYNHSTNKEKLYIKNILENSKVIYLERTNKGKQAISAYKSKNTKVFHSTDTQNNGVKLVYDFEEIFQLYKAYVIKEKKIKTFLIDADINYLYIAYEEFVKDPKKYFKLASKFCDVETTENDYIPSIYKKVSNKNSDYLYNKFKNDLKIELDKS